MRKLTIAIAAMLATTTGCAKFTSFTNDIHNAAPTTDDYRGLTNWSAELDEFRDRLRRYDLYRDPNDLTFEYAIQKADGPAVRRIDRSENYPAALESYVRAREDQIDGLCSAFFNSLQNLSSTSRWGRDQVNALAEFSALMLGLGGAASKQLAALSGVQVLFNDSYDAASAALLISADPYRVHQAVKVEQTDYTHLHQGDEITTFRQAEAWVRGYAEPCTLMGIQRLISDALDSQIEGRQGEPQMAVRLASITATLNALKAPGAAQLSRGELTEETLPILYWLLRLQPPAAEATQALAQLPPPMKARVETLFANPDTPLRLALEAQLDQIDRLSPSTGRAARKLQGDFRAEAEAAAAADRAALAAAANAPEEPEGETPDVGAGTEGEEGGAPTDDESPASP